MQVVRYFFENESAILFFIRREHYFFSKKYKIVDSLYYIRFSSAFFQMSISFFRFI